MQRRSALLLAAVLLAVSFALPAYSAETTGSLDDCLYMDIGDVIANPGEDIMVPVLISETTGWGVMAFEMEICWCDLPAGLLQYIGCSAGDVMHYSSWGDPVCGFCGPNCISIAAAGTLPLRGKGSLVKLMFHVSANAKPCMCCPLRFNRIALYDPEDPLNVCSEGGVVCIEWCTVIARVVNWWCEFDECGWPELPYSIPGARAHLSLCGEPIATDYTDQNGWVTFDCLEPLRVIAVRRVNDVAHHVLEEDDTLITALARVIEEGVVLHSQQPYRQAIQQQVEGREIQPLIGERYLGVLLPFRFLLHRSQGGLLAIEYFFRRLLVLLNALRVFFPGNLRDLAHSSLYRDVAYFRNNSSA